MNPKVKVVTKAALAKKVIKKNIQANQKIQFDDHGTVLPNETMKKSEIGQMYEQEESTERCGIDVSRVKEVLKAEDKFDKQLAKEKRKAKKREEKLKKQENSKRNQQQTVSVFGNICLFACKIINFGYFFRHYKVVMKMILLSQKMTIIWIGFLIQTKFTENQQIKILNKKTFLRRRVMMKGKLSIFFPECRK